MLEGLADVEVSVADCKRRKGPRPSWVGVGIDELRVSNKDDMVRSRCSRLEVNQHALFRLSCFARNLKYPAFPIAPGAIFYTAPEHNLFTPPKHHPPYNDQGERYIEQIFRLPRPYCPYYPPSSSSYFTPIHSRFQPGA